jgi:AcrR family transcriptional regulator
MATKASQKARTMQALLHALQDELLESGRLTVEAIAQRASVNKALLYRYFGGLDGLVIAFASSEEFMPSAATVLKQCGDGWLKLKPRERLLRCVQVYIHLLAARPATIQLLQRMPMFSDEILAALSVGRSREIEQIREAIGPHTPTIHFDGEMAFYLLISGACSLLGNRHNKWYNCPQQLEELAIRINNTLSALFLPVSSK